MSTPVPAGFDPDLTRRLFEQLGTLYTAADDADAADGAHVGEGAAVQELADFLDTVGRALRNPQGGTAQALRLALHRYEHSRAGAA